MEHTCSPSSQTVDLASLDLESSRGSTSDTPSVLNSCVASATSVHQSKLTVEVSCRAGRGESKFRRVAGTCKCAARRVKAFQHNINATRRENKGALATEMVCFAPLTTYARNAANCGACCLLFRATTRTHSSRKRAIEYLSYEVSLIELEQESDTWIAGAYSSTKIAATQQQYGVCFGSINCWKTTTK